MQAGIELVIQNRTGLHARPAREFVNLAKKFQADVRVLHGGRKANGKSLVSLLTLGAKQGAAIRIEVDGPDAEAALDALTAAVASGLNDEPAAAAAPPAQAPVPLPSPEAQAPLAAGALRGIPAAPGVAIGPLHQLVRAAEPIRRDEQLDDPYAEAGKLREAIATARHQVAAIRERLAGQATAADAAIFDVHLEILEDPDLLAAAAARVTRGEGAVRSWQSALEERAVQVAVLEDALLAARAADLRDVAARVVRILTGVVEDALAALPDRPVILVASDLSPSETASLDRTRILGLCTAAGGPTSHAAILARALALPSVVNAGPEVLTWPNGTTVVLDGEAGVIERDPDPARVARAQEAQAAAAARRREAERTASDPAVTRDGHRVEVVANVGSAEEAVRAQAAGAEGVGLLRTEFLFLERTQPPGEDEQHRVYANVASALRGQPVIIRTLDVGGDKPLPYLDLRPEANPFLGERGIRLCLARPALFREQLRAILRATTAGRIRIMFPMIADLREWRAARALVREVATSLKVQEVEVGIMVEVPSAALLAGAFAREVDFFSIGSNDLTQYTLAMDRGHPGLAAQADGLHPAVLALIARTVEGAHREKKWVGICGELGSDPVAVPILVGLGVDELSVSVPAIAAVKAQVRGLGFDDAKKVAEVALACSTAAEVRQKARLP
ncbi:MAG: phosphoenolpyruvate--protein phosphotransferase [Anaeromyxobacter sp.]